MEVKISKSPCISFWNVFNFCSDRYSLSLEEESLIWRKLGGSAKLRLASFELSAFNFEDAQSEIIGKKEQANS